MPPLWEDSLPLRIRTVLRVELSEIRTIPHPATGGLKTVSIMELYTAIIPIMPAESWDSGPEPAERYRTAEIMVCYRQPMEQTG